MMTQEEYVKEVLELKSQGWTVTEIAEELWAATGLTDRFAVVIMPPDARRCDGSLLRSQPG